MTEPVIGRCIGCGRPVTRKTRQEDHIFRKRNSDVVNIMCAECNNKFLAKWDLSGELPAGPADAFANMARRLILIFQSSGESEIANLARQVERSLINDHGWNSSNGRNHKRRRVAPASEHRDDVVLQILDSTNLLREFWDQYLPRCPIDPIDRELLFRYLRKVEQNPALFCEFWESEDHAALMKASAAVITTCTQNDLISEMNTGQIFGMLMQAMVSEACQFLTWLSNRIKIPEHVS